MFMIQESGGRLYRFSTDTGETWVMSQYHDEWVPVDIKKAEKDVPLYVGMVLMVSQQHEHLQPCKWCNQDTTATHRTFPMTITPRLLALAYEEYEASEQAKARNQKQAQEAVCDGEPPVLSQTFKAGDIIVSDEHGLHVLQRTGDSTT